MGRQRDRGSIACVRFPPSRVHPPNKGWADKRVFLSSWLIARTRRRVDGEQIEEVMGSAAPQGACLYTLLPLSARRRRLAIGQPRGARG